LFTQLSLIYFSLGNIHDTNNLARTPTEKKTNQQNLFFAQNSSTDPFHSDKFMDFQLKGSN